MFAKIFILLSLQVIIAVAEAMSFLDLKKVIRGALDAVTAVPSSATANYGFNDTSHLTTKNGGVQGIDPIIRKRLSRLFHIPPDFVHQLAAQTGFIDYEPTTARPLPNYWFPEYNIGSPFIQEDPSVAANSADSLSPIVQEQQQESNFFNNSQINPNHTIPEEQIATLQSEQQAVVFQPVIKDSHFSFFNNSHINRNHTVSEQQIATLQSEQQAIVFQPVIKDGHLYYQQFGVLPQGGQPRMIIYGGRLYMATPLQSEIHAEEVTANGLVTKNLSEMNNKNKNNHIASNISTEQNNIMNYHRIYAQNIKAAEDARIQAAKLQQIIVPDASPNKIPGIENNERISPSPLPSSSSSSILSSYPKVYKKEIENYDKLQQINLQNESNFKQHDKVNSVKNDEIIDVQSTTISNTQQTDMHQTQIYSSWQKVEKDENAELVNNDQSMRRILALRRKMAADRKKFANRKRLLSSMKRKVYKDDDLNREIFRRHCANIRSLALQYGFTGIKQYVIANCMILGNYYPEFRCSQAEISVDKC